jgi:hypothetical protein
MRTRLALISVGAIVALALSATGAQAALPQPIYFFTDTAEPINNRNPLVIRPSGFLMFQDGSWVLERLHWTGWGSSVAHATGVSNASNDIPDVASGKRIKSPAYVTLSNPGRFRGHEVYRCFSLSVPAFPPSDQHLCLGHANGVYIMEETTHASPKESAPKPAGKRVEFYTGKGVNCAMIYEPGPHGSHGIQQAACASRQAPPPGGEAFVQEVELKPNGEVTRGCDGPEPAKCNPGNAGIAPTFATGKVTTVGPFTCKVLETGVECTITATGKGFLITPETVTEVGG